MKRFFKEDYKNSSTDKNWTAVIRNVERGFNPFIIDALESVDNLTADRERQLSLCELGIGGGGSHAMLVWHTQDTHVLGVDLFDVDNLKEYQDARHDEKIDNHDIFLLEWQTFKADQTNSHFNVNNSWDQTEDELNDPLTWRPRTKSNRKPSLFHGMDAYKRTTAEHLVKVNGAKLDYVNDDASPDLGALNGLMDAYKDSISDQGILLSTGPFGNGTEQVYNHWLSGEYVKDLDTLAEQGFVIFDMTEYRQKHQLAEDITYILSYLAMWSPNFNNYNDLLEKYEHNIIKGKENWKHD